MRTPEAASKPLGAPVFSTEAHELATLLHHAPADTLIQLMKISAKKVAEVHRLHHDWIDGASQQTPAIDTFVGDIYSGLQVHSWSDADRTYAHEHLLILSGLYGALRACDGIAPYRLEMGYKLPGGRSLYEFWGHRLAAVIHPNTSHILNLSAVEYTKALLPHISLPIITPKFLTVSPKTGEPTFVTVHTKIARGAFARWLVQQRVSDINTLSMFSELGYIYDASRSSSEQPVFVCQKFGGLGLSIRKS